MNIKTYSIIIALVTGLVVNSGTYGRDPLPFDSLTFAYPVEYKSDSFATFRTRVETHEGKLDLSHEPLEEISRRVIDGRTLKILSPSSVANNVRRIIALPKSKSEVLWSRSYSAQLSWGEKQIEQRFGIKKFRLDVTVIALPKGIRYNRQFSNAASIPKINLTIGVSLPESEDPENWLFNIMFFGASTALHEAVHMLVTYDGHFEFEKTNDVSDEARAYLFSTCAAIVTGLQPMLQLTSGVPVDPDTAAKFIGQPSKIILNAAKKSLKGKMRMTPSVRGSILAGIAIAEAAGGESALGEDRSQFERFCQSALDDQIDWLRVRPCQLANFASACKTPHADERDSANIPKRGRR